MEPSSAEEYGPLYLIFMFSIPFAAMVDLLVSRIVGPFGPIRDTRNSTTGIENEKGFKQTVFLGWRRVHTPTM